MFNCFPAIFFAPYRKRDQDGIGEEQKFLLVVSLQSHFATSCDGFAAYRSLSGHSQLWNCADLNTTFASIRNQIYASDTSRNPPSVSFDVRSFTESAKPLFVQTFTPYYITLSYLVRNSDHESFGYFGHWSIIQGFLSVLVLAFLADLY